MNRFILTTISTFALASSAFADLNVRFDEGAPKDRFSFSNTSNCSLKNATITLDLSGSKSGLIFDVTNKGAGVEVFQPLEFVEGKAALNSLPKVRDGDNKVVLDVRELGPKQTIAFTIDVDDTMGGREITVSGSEIAGAIVKLEAQGATIQSPFSSQARANLKQDSDCS